jgi:hypothetical protein
MAAQSPEARETVAVRPGLWRPSVAIPWGVVVGLFIAGAISEFVGGNPGQAAVALTAPVLLFLLAALRARSVRLEVTESAVLARQGRWRGHPDLEVPRNEIRAIHYFPRIISFRGPDNEPFMRIDCNYTLRQMTKVADVLGVRLYDHRGSLGLREVRIGRLAYDPDSPRQLS